jgi:23S rRNA (pseudouridine1915-N3)-methyltransferase
MKFTLLFVGKGKFPFVEAGLEHYLKSIRTMAEVEVVVVKDHAADKEKEAAMILAALSKRKLLGDGKIQVVLLDEKGKTYSSVKFAARLGAWRDRGVRQVVFLVGGAFGFTQEMRREFPEQLSLSPMTFPHDLIRLFLSEQIYRALHIQAGGKYHHEG